MTLNVGNCTRCGKLYAKNPIHDVCPACVKEYDKMYEVVSKYLRENRGSTIQEVVDVTEVPFKQVVRFIREGRISTMNMPNLHYPCESCGEPIKESHICGNCRKKLSKDYQNMNEDDQRRQQQQKQANHVSYNIKDRLYKERD